MKRFFAGILCAALGALLCAAAPALSGPALADEIRIGVIGSYSGAYADYGRQFDNGIELFLKENGGRLAGRDVRIIRKDTSGPAPDRAKRFAQELVVRDEVDFIVGLDFSPNALAVAAVATEARVPTIVMNAASSGIPTKSAYVARVSFTVAQVSAPMARWALDDGLREAFVVVSDYAPGIDAETAFVRTFTEGGGRVAGVLRVPLSNPDFAAYIQRIRAERPQAVFFFFPSGEQPSAFLRAFNDAGLKEAGIRLIATGEATDDSFLQAMGDAPLGLITSHHYSYAHPSPRNARFVAGYRDAFGDALRPSYMAVAAYDGMAALAAALEKTGGDTGGEAVMAALAGLRLESPRGPIEIDARTRDIVQTVYIRRTEEVDGETVNVEFDSYEAVADPTYAP
jgi:branched-chain amino acid transport system substrate-binding protein